MWSSPSATSTSPTSTAGADPSRSNAFTPIAALLIALPGTAITGIPRSAAIWAVINDPPVSRLSTTTTISDRAATRRLRCGKRYATGTAPGGHSLSNRPSAPTRSHRVRCSRG